MKATSIRQTLSIYGPEQEADGSEYTFPFRYEIKPLNPYKIRSFINELQVISPFFCIEIDFPIFLFELGDVYRGESVDVSHGEFSSQMVGCDGCFQYVWRLIV